MKLLLRRSLSLILFLVWLIASVSGQGLPTTAPEKVGLSPERLNRIDKVMEDYVAKNRVAGIVTLVARHGKAAYLKSFGMADIEADKPMTTDAIFRIASMSKPVTCTAIMMLHEEGHFLLDDPVSKYIPEFKNPRVLADDLLAKLKLRKTVPAKREITIRHLLTHTSGIGYSVFNAKLRPIYRDAGVPDGMVGINSKIGEKVKILAGLPLAHHPGEDQTYGLSIDVLGYLVEVISGMALDEFFKERIFEPLQMKDTYFFLPDKKVSRLATLYEPTKDGDLKAYPDSIVERKHLLFSAGFPYEGAKTYFSGGAGLCSTVSDYVRFLQMLLNGGELDGVRLLSRKSVELMTINQIGELASPGWGDGFGFPMVTDLGKSGTIGSEGKFGWGGIFNTEFWVDPTEELITIIMTQKYPYDWEILEKFDVLSNQAIVD